MATYKELLKRALDALPDNTPPTRRAVYEKARSALVGQLRAIAPPLPARDITQHRLQLEDSIRAVEQEAVDDLMARVDVIVRSVEAQADERDRQVRLEHYGTARIELGKVLPGLGKEDDDICREIRQRLETEIRKVEGSHAASASAEEAILAAAAATGAAVGLAERPKTIVRVRTLVPPPNASLPKQQRGVPVFDETTDGRIDLAPPQPSEALDASEEIREGYHALRSEAEKLLGQGNGNLLGDARGEVAALLAAMPADVTRVRTYALWRAGNKLRRLYRAHVLVTGQPEGHPSALDPAIAELVGALCDEFNNIASTDPGLRRCDQRRVPPQEAVIGQYEQLAPVIAGAIDAGVVTPEARGQIVADVPDASAAEADPYGLQDAGLTNDARQNFVVKLLSVAFEAAKAIAAQGARQVAIAADKFREGFYANAGTMASTTMGAAILGVIVNNGPTISNFVATTFNSPNINAAVDWLLKLFGAV